MIHLLFPFNAWGIHQVITILAGKKKKRLIPSHMWVFAMVQFWFPGSYTFSCSISFSNFQKFYPMLVQIGIPVFNQRLKKTLMERTEALSLFCFLFFFLVVVPYFLAIFNSQALITASFMGKLYCLDLNSDFAT